VLSRFPLSCLSLVFLWSLSLSLSFSLSLSLSLSLVLLVSLSMALDQSFLVIRSCDAPFPVWVDVILSVDIKHTLGSRLTASVRPFNRATSAQCSRCFHFFFLFNDKRVVSSRVVRSTTIPLPHLHASLVSAPLSSTKTMDLNDKEEE